MTELDSNLKVDSDFSKKAEMLRKEGRLEEALMTCLFGLSEDFSCYQGRLVLAHIYYDLKLLPFCAEEIEKISLAYPENSAIRSLRDKFMIAPLPQEKEPSKEGAEEVLAEAEFDFDDIDLV